MEPNLEKNQWELWEVFIQLKNGESHEHAGSLRAPDKEMALQNARDVYGRREKVKSIWVVNSKDIAVTTEKDNPSFFGSIDDKVHRHPHFYKIPDEIKDAFKKS